MLATWRETSSVFFNTLLGLIRAINAQDTVRQCSQSFLADIFCAVFALQIISRLDAGERFVYAFEFQRKFMIECNERFAVFKLNGLFCEVSR